MCNDFVCGTAWQNALKENPSQQKSSEANLFASRLREERLKVEPNQGKFAARIGVPRALQSFRETGERDLRADYLSLVAEVGIDVGYIITGQRSGDALSDRESELISLCRLLPADFVDALVALARSAAGSGPPATRDSMPSATVHDKKIDYRVD